MSKSKQITEFFARSCESASSSSANNESNNEDIAESASQNQLHHPFTFSSPLNLNQGSPAIGIRDKPFHPGKGFKFPKTKFGSRERSCQCSWFESYKWLHYNQENDSVMCFICATEEKKGNLRSERMKEFAYISWGFRSWKKAPKCFEEHQASSCHKTALSFHVLVPQCGDVVEMVNDHLVKSRLEERRYFYKVMECVQFLGRQGIAFQLGTGYIL